MKKWLIFLIGFSMFATAAPQPEVRGTDLLNGKAIALKAGTKGLVVAFLSSSCPCSKSHVPELIALSQSHPEFQFVAVHSNGDESEATAREYFRSAGLPFPVIQDQDAAIADQYRALKTPHTFVFAQDGQLVFQGGMSDSKDCAQSDKKYLRDALEDLAKGQKVRVASVRTLGCTISRKNHVL